MTFERLKHRVERSERLLEGRTLHTHQQLASLKTAWRDSWTPPRIVLAGLAAGFLVGRAEPERALKQLGGLGGTRWIQLVGALSGLFASLQSSLAAAHADAAADSADEAADDAGDAADQAGDAMDQAAATREQPQAAPRDDRRRPDPGWETQPRAAEAATEVSEASRR